MVDIDIYRNCFDYDCCNISIDDDSFLITFMGNGDLYWIYNSSDFDRNSFSFIVDRENYFLYSCFKELYDSIKNSTVGGNLLPPYQDSSNIELYNDGIVTWYSDDYPKEIGSSLSIEEIDDNYMVTFKRGNLGKMDAYSNLSIRICNSGSRYDPYNYAFMSMYNKLKNYDNQMHIEELIYREKVKVINK